MRIDEKNGVIHLRGFFGNKWSKPINGMPVVAHKAIGTFLKELHVFGGHKKDIEKHLSSIRCELDDWVQFEHKDRKELPDMIFFNLYMRCPAPKRAEKLDAYDAHQVDAILNSVRSTLRTYYNDCQPLRIILKKLDTIQKRFELWNNGPLVSNARPCKPDSKREERAQI